MLVGNYCSPHRNGVPVGMPPFFVAGCLQCERKKAAGQVIGDEGTPPQNWRRKAYPRIDYERVKREKAARQRTKPLEIQAPKVYR